MKKIKAKTIICWLMFLCVYGVIFWFSSQPADNSTEQSSFVVDIIVEQYFSDIDTMPAEQATATLDVLTVGVRKLAHFSVFALLGFCGFLALSGIRSFGLRYAAALVMCISCAGLDEFHQSFVPGRAGMLSDVLIDGVGAACGAFVALAFCAVWALSKLKKH